MSDEPSAEVRELAAKLFAAGRAEQPGPALGRRLLLLEASHPRPSVVSPRAGVASMRSRWVRGLAAAALLVSGAGLWLVLQHDAPELSISAERLPGRPPSSSPEPSAVAAPAPALPPPEEAKPPLSESRPRVEAAKRVAPPRELPPRPREAPRPEVTSTDAPPALTPSAATSAAPPPKAKAMTLLGELELLKRARSALRSGDGEQALELLDRHARERASNGLDAEATLLRIEALAAVGRHADASALAARFVRDNPNSALGDRAKSFIRAAAPKGP
jgi:hypothetical protein